MLLIKNKITLEDAVRELKLFAIAGPTMLGWIFGLLHYPISSKLFLVSFQNGVVSLFFLGIYGFFYILNLFFSFPPDIILLYMESVFSLLYLGITLFFYAGFRQKEKIPGSDIIQSLLDRMFLK